MITQGLKQLTPTTRVFITNFSDFDVQPLVEFVGEDVDFGSSLIKLSHHMMSGSKIAHDSERIESLLEDFNSKSDYLMVSGRGFVNFIVGSVFSEMFHGEEITLLLWDAAQKVYRPQKWTVGE